MIDQQLPSGTGLFSLDELAAARHMADELGFVTALISARGGEQSIEVAPFGTAPATPLDAWDIAGTPSNGKGVWSLVKDAQTDKAVAIEHSGGKGRRLIEDSPAEALRSIAILHEAEDGTYLG